MKHRHLTPPARMHPAHRFGGVVFTVVVLAAVGVLLASLASVQSRQDAQRAPITPTTTPEPEVSAPAQAAPGTSVNDGRPDPPYRRMAPEDSRLYNVAFARSSARCRNLSVQRPPVPDDRLIAHLQTIADCLGEVNQDALAQQKVTVPPVKVRGFKVEIPTACGVQSRYAFYCPEDQTIYVDLRADDSWRFFGRMRLGYLAVISHEYGHHLQLAGGITRGYADMLATADGPRRLELSRRSELQAACFSGVAYGALWSSVRGSEDDIQEMYDYFSRYNDEITREGTHGTAVSMRAWFRAGFEGQWSSYARCNTWRAGTDQVA